MQSTENKITSYTEIIYPITQDFLGGKLKIPFHLTMK